MFLKTIIRPTNSCSRRAMEYKQSGQWRLYVVFLPQ